MSSNYTVIPESTFDNLQLNAGILLSSFDPSTGTVTDTNIITATTGGITVSCKPSFSDLGEDVDNCPNNMMELKMLENWDCSMAFTALNTSPAAIKIALGCATVNSSDSTRVDLDAPGAVATARFSTIWWVGEKADGGYVAVELQNALSTEGFQLKTTKNGKGQVSVTITGHVSINAQDTMPMTFYSIDA
ncbi:MAG: hypothetical protein K5637_01975 [Lachnospiraceae bacterium]|nr:hypothetical protein [Lachnospiraceae bacterium]